MKSEELNELIDTAFESDDQTSAVIFLAAHLRKMNEENKYLSYFHSESDFGPADTDVRMEIQRQYEESGNVIPDGWKYE